MSKKKKKRINDNLPSPAATESEATKAEEVKVEEDKVEETKVEEVKAEETTAEEVKPEETKPEADKKSKKALKKSKGGKKSSIRDLDDHIKEALDDALDESADNLSQAETESEAVNAAAHINLKQVATTVFGFFIIVFAIIGIVATSIKVSDYIEAQSDDTKLVATFESLVLPLAACDAAVFDDISALSEDVLITAACWDALLNPSNTFVEESGYYTVSYLDIDVRIAKLFGTGLTYTHKSVGDSEISFDFDEATGMYTLPAYPKTVSYLPVLDSYTETEAGYELRVKYVYPVTTIISGVANAEKIMIYNVAPKDLGYVITSLQIGELVTGEEL